MHSSALFINTIILSCLSRPCTKSSIKNGPVSRFCYKKIIVILAIICKDKNAIDADCFVVAQEYCFEKLSRLVQISFFWVIISSSVR